VIPAGVDASWALDRSALWNAAERAENRKDARVAREFEIALPHELTPEQRLAATREFAQGLADRYGAAVDFAIHASDGASFPALHNGARKARDPGNKGVWTRRGAAARGPFAGPNSEKATPTPVSIAAAEDRNGSRARRNSGAGAERRVNRRARHRRC
jgi:MobA/MobL family